MRIFWVLIIGLNFPFIGLGQEVVLSTSNLPIIIINTSENSLVPKNFKIDAIMKISYDNTGGRNSISGPFTEYNGKIGIKGRGSSSWETYAKKGYTLETRTELDSNNNVPLLGLPEENDWVLHGPYGDKTLMKNAFVYTVGRELGRYAPRTRFCELVLNDVYSGVYVLTEKIKRDKNRVDIAKLNPGEVANDDLTGGYILSIDRIKDEYWPPLIDFNGGFSQYNYIYPDPTGDMPQAQKNYIRNYVTDFEDALLNKAFSDRINGYRAYINLPSFIDYFIMNEWTKNIDAYRLSTYMYKDKNSKGGKLTMGPLWDYNLSCGGVNIGYGNWGATAENWIYEEYDGQPFWWSRLLIDRYYNSCLQQRWIELRENILNEDHYEPIIDEFAVLLDEAKERNFQKHPLEEAVWGNDHQGFNYQQEIDTLKGFFRERLKWMDMRIASLPAGEECLECFQCEPSVVLGLESPDLNFDIYPNPATNRVTLSKNLQSYSEVQFVLHDLTGRMVSSQNFTLAIGNHLLPIDLSHINSSGTLIYSVLTPSGKLISGKLIKQ